ncbi:uncharacterized protein LOC106766467 isoform X2 [Vigna radiata var. radiata]|uniref:Uncharacterized protein LOC106766467 isoform X2 n=1 Tax=Vigna radiata var. radiata TaxID=3916 RepID=A0A1S3UKW4_VIGRR|nr:uncharacterized protein LOC106766467 isoform X2 [Vigna radiata var. radiata]
MNSPLVIIMFVFARCPRPCHKTLFYRFVEAVEADKALEEVFISGDQMCGSSSSCKCTGWGFEQSSGGGSKLGAKPSCYCGTKVVFRWPKPLRTRANDFGVALTSRVGVERWVDATSFSGAMKKSLMNKI